MPSNLSEKDLEFLKTDEEIINKNDDKPVKSVEDIYLISEVTILYLLIYFILYHISKIFPMFFCFSSY